MIAGPALTCPAWRGSFFDPQRAKLLADSSMRRPWPYSAAEGARVAGFLLRRDLPKLMTGFSKA
jgi:hypothetical protein